MTRKIRVRFPVPPHPLLTELVYVSALEAEFCRFESYIGDQTKRLLLTEKPAKKKQNPEWYKEYYAKNRERKLAMQRAYYAKNRERLLEVHRPIAAKWFQKNKERIVAQRKKRRDEKPEVALAHLLRSRLNNALKNKGIKKSQKTLDLLGCTPAEFFVHIESQFTAGMSWENRRGCRRRKTGWEIDHILPVASFDLTDPEQQKACFHYTNLQPLWAQDNMKKGSKAPVLTRGTW